MVHFCCKKIIDLVHLSILALEKTVMSSSVQFLYTDAKCRTPLYDTM